MTKTVQASIVSVRGTDDCLDWMDNLARWQNPFLTSNVHSGFLRQMVRIKDTINTHIEDHQSPEIHLVGHSLGGAVSLLLGVWLSCKYRDKNVYVTTFGSPRVGDKQFQDFCISSPNLGVTRVFNNLDTVTHIPYFNYYHVGKNVQVVSGYWFWNVCKNHSMYTYRDSLETLISKV